jgi:CheY-like chemotaxis protein
MRVDEMGARSAKILCVEYDPVVLESRCAVLKYSGYDAASSSPQAAEILLRSQKFDLLVVSSLSNYDLHRIIDLSTYLMART